MVGAAKKEHAHLPLVPESVLRKRHDLDELARKRRATQLALQEQRGKKGRLVAARGAGGGGGGAAKGKKAFYVKKPETIVARARSRKNYAKRYHRVARRGMQKRASDKPEYATKEIEMDDDEKDDEEELRSDAEVSSDEGEETKNAGKASNSKKATTIKYQKNSVGAKLVFAIRIRDHLGAPPPVLNALNKMRLSNVHDGVFLRYDDQTRRQLHLVEPFVVYGPPTRAVVADLVERRGHASVDGTRVPLSDNTVIEDALSERANILCKEDLVHEIFNVGEHFDAATEFLWPFKLADSKSFFERRTLKLKDGKSYGDRGDAIVEYVQEVL